jgi:tetrapyrrole methylase family protein / MazG family protein
LNFIRKETYTMDDLLHIMEILRSEQGCPWDREQTHKSIRNNFLEEAYEAVEAIDTSDSQLLCEELGDVLLQVVFHSQLEKEQNVFSFSDVVDGICKKLILRHPHVFGDVSAKNSEEVLSNWEAIKKEEKGRKTNTQVLKGVSKALPALMRAQKIRKKAAKAAGEELELSESLNRLEECVKLFTHSADSTPQEEQRKNLGQLLFSVAEISGILHIEAEQALSETCDDFIAQFEEQEKQSDCDNSGLEG